MGTTVPSWLNSDLVEKALRKSEKNDAVRVVNLYAKPATAKGDNYTSDMIRVTVEFSLHPVDRKLTEKRSLIVKVGPTPENSRYELITKAGLFDTEISMMTDTLRKMSRLLGAEHRLSARELFSQNGQPTFLIIEDLAPHGYRMADRQAGMDLDHSLHAIRGLARFHASSVALCEKEPEQAKKYNKAMFDESHPNDLKNFFILGTKTLGEEVAKWPELGPRYSEKIVKISDGIYDKASKSIKCREGEFNVINHGDFWVNNMLFRYDDNGKPVDHIFVDFQLCYYGTPALDLQYFLNTSLSQNVRANHTDLLLDEYRRVLGATMRCLGCETTPPDAEELRSAMRKRAIYGMTAAFNVLPFVLVEKSDAKSLDEMIGENGTYENPGYKSANYRETISRLIPRFEEMGLL